jgi:hypothetical protein
VLRALFGGGAKRTVKPSKELASVEEAEAATPVTCDMVILSKSPGGQWNEHLYLDRVTVCDGLVCHTGQGPSPARWPPCLRATTQQHTRVHPLAFKRCVCLGLRGVTRVALLPECDCWYRSHVPSDKIPITHR